MFIKNHYQDIFFCEKFTKMKFLKNLMKLDCSLPSSSLKSRKTELIRAKKHALWLTKTEFTLWIPKREMGGSLQNGQESNCQKYRTRRPGGGEWEQVWVMGQSSVSGKGTGAFCWGPLPGPWRRLLPEQPAVLCRHHEACCTIMFLIRGNSKVLNPLLHSSFHRLLDHFLVLLCISRA